MSRFHGKYGGNLGFSVRENTLRSPKLIPGTSRLTPPPKKPQKQVILSPFFPSSKFRAYVHLNWQPVIDSLQQRLLEQSSIL